MTDTKNILTRKDCKETLLKQMRAACGSNWIMLVGVLLLTVPMVCLGIYIAKWTIVGGALFAVIFLSPLGVFTVQMVRDVMVLRLVERDAFSVVEDDVCRMAAGELSGRSTVDAIYFTTYGRFVPSGAVFSLTSVNDRFYLVILHTKRPKPILAFPFKMYDYRESRDNS